MPKPTLRIHGATVEAYFQMYRDFGAPDSRSGELLTRHKNSNSAQVLISSLADYEHLDLLRWLVDWNNHIFDHYNVKCSINVDNAVLIRKENRDEFLKIAETSRRPTLFEFTELKVMPPALEANKILRRLRELGHQTALDDFGSGLNGMTLLTDYDFDVVKVDRTLTLGIDKRKDKFEVLNLLKSMLDVLEKESIIEGVEDEEIFSKLHQIGFKKFQGFLFFKPVPVEELGQVLNKAAMA